MELMLVIVIGILYSAGFYLLLRRSFIKIIVGLILLGNAVNLLIFTAGRVTSGNPAFTGPGGFVSGDIADPLPQALVLTAIVIGFGIQAFVIVLFRRVWEAGKEADPDKLKASED